MLNGQPQRSFAGCLEFLHHYDRI